MLSANLPGSVLPHSSVCAPGEALMSQEIIEHIAQVVEQKGSDVWWQADVEALLPESLKSRAGQLRKGLDTMDV